MCVVEVGMGGRFDATNVVASPVACGVAMLDLDHTQVKRNITAMHYACASSPAQYATVVKKLVFQVRQAHALFPRQNPESRAQGKYSKYNLRKRYKTNGGGMRTILRTVKE